MGKHSRKRQRTDKINDSQPLGSSPFVNLLHDEASKDDEERRLESILFGVPYTKGRESKDIIVVEDGDDDVESGKEDGGRELDGMMDTDLFFVDTGPVSEPQTINELDEGIGFDDEEQDKSGDSQSESESDRDEVPSSPSDEAGEEKIVEYTEVEPSPTNQNSFPNPRTRKAPAWTDPSDPALEISLTNPTQPRLRKLREAPIESTISGREYERRLRKQFEKINPAPGWVGKARKGVKRAREAKDEDGQMEGILNSTRGILGKEGRGTALEKATLNIERLRDANLAAKAEGEIKAVQFHPSPQIPVLLAASSDRRLRLFNIDGHTNPHLQTLHIPSLPLTTATFHPSGLSILLTGPRPYFYTYDLQSSQPPIRSPRGLWGSSGLTDPASSLSLETCAFSPTGNFLAVAGRRGYVHLVDWTNGGAGQVVGSVKMNAGVRSVWWARGTGKEELMTLGEDSQVYVWDVGERKCVRRWKDEGGFGSRIIVGNRRGDHLATGSTTGFVNVYGRDAAQGSAFANDFDIRPTKPLKTIGNLTTSISSLCFNHDSQILALASNAKKDQMRMIHLPSLTAFSNWPTSSTPLGHVQAIDFSAGSEYVAVGNNRGRVLLYHLRDFAPR